MTVKISRRPARGAIDTSQDHAIVGACRRLHAAIDALDEAAARAAGVSRSELRCLNLLETGPVPATHVARALQLATGSLTAMADRLERKGLIERLRDERDRRVVHLCATPQTYALIGPVYRRLALRLMAWARTAAPDETARSLQHMGLLTDACEQAVLDAQAQP